MKPQLQTLIEALARSLEPPPALDLADWCEQNVYLSPEDSAARGLFRPWAFQREPMSCMSPSHGSEKVVLLCASQTMKTRLLLNMLAYIICVDPGPTLIVEPTEKDAEQLSKDRVDSMARDTPALQGMLVEKKSRDVGNTIAHKRFRGGHVTFGYATSASQLSMRPIRYLLMDEVSRKEYYDGREGSPIDLAEARTRTFWNRKIIYASSPAAEGECRISELFAESDQRQWHCPCPHCGHEQILEFGGLRWSQHGEPVKHMVRVDGVAKPAETVIPASDPRYLCVACECLIEFRQRGAMVEAGRYIAMNPNGAYPGFRINSLVSPAMSWQQIVAMFLVAKDQPERLRVFTNTVLAETWQDRGATTDDEKIWLRAQARMPHKPDPLPEWVLFLTSGIDVQPDRVEIQVVGWGRHKRSCLVDYHVIHGRSQDLALATTDLSVQIGEALARTYRHASGLRLGIVRTAIDSGYATQDVYAFARRHSSSSVFVIKGYDSGVSILGQPSTADVLTSGKRKRHGVKVWPVNVSQAKSELYSWLNLEAPAAGQPLPAGWCESYDAGREFFRQLCAEQWTLSRQRNGHMRGMWTVISGRRAEVLDTRNYARAAAEHVGISRWTNQYWDAMESQLAVAKESIIEEMVQSETDRIEAPVVQQVRQNQMTQRRQTRSRYLS